MALRPATARGRRLEELVRTRWSGSISALSDRARLSVPVMYAWFRGDHDPSIEALRKVAKVLHISVHELVAAFEGEPLVVPAVELETADGRVIRIEVRASAAKTPSK